MYVRTRTLYSYTVYSVQGEEEGEEEEEHAGKDILSVNSEKSNAFIRHDCLTAVITKESFMQKSKHR